MNVTLTLVFDNAAQAHEALSRLTDRPIVSVISHADLPDVGVELQAPATVAPLGLPNMKSFDAPFNPFLADPGAQVTGIAPPVPVAAVVPQVPQVPTATGVEVDAKGIPWDGRIHGSTKTKNADGTWRQKRGLNDEALKQRIETELRAAMAAKAPAAPGLTTVTASMVAPLVPNAPALTPQPVVSAAPVAPPVPPAQQPAAPAAPVTGETFGQLMARLAPITMGEPSGVEKVNKALGMFGLTALSQLASRPDLVGPYAATIDAMLAAPVVP